MWIPRPFRCDDVEAQHDLIESYDFATLVSPGEGGRLSATHLPFLLDRERGELGSLVAHMARANPHWKTLNDEVLVIFQGPHAYVSPSWYEEQVTVPTWNYAVVHAYGTPVLIHEPERLRPLVERLTRLHESAVTSTWRLAQAEPVMDSELRAIVGFEIPIARLEGKFKLNQNRSAADRRGVVRALSQSTDPLVLGVARLMSRDLPDDGA